MQKFNSEKGVFEVMATGTAFVIVFTVAVLLGTPTRNALHAERESQCVAGNAPEAIFKDASGERVRYEIDCSEDAAFGGVKVVRSIPVG